MLLVSPVFSITDVLTAASRIANPETGREGLEEKAISGRTSKWPGLGRMAGCRTAPDRARACTVSAGLVWAPYMIIILDPGGLVLEGGDGW